MASAGLEIERYSLPSIEIEGGGRSREVEDSFRSRPKIFGTPTVAQNRAQDARECAGQFSGTDGGSASAQEGAGHYRKVLPVLDCDRGARKESGY